MYLVLALLKLAPVNFTLNENMMMMMDEHNWTGNLRIATFTELTCIT